MKQTITLALLISMAACVQAQVNSVKRKFLDLSIGWQKFTFLDKHASPLAYSTNSIFPNIGLAFRRQTAYSDFSIGVSGTKGNLSPIRYGTRRYETKFDDSTLFHYNVASQFYHINFNATYYRKLLLLSTGKVAYWIGGMVNEAGYYGDAVANMPWLFNEVDISPSVKIEYTPFRRHIVSAEADIAVLGLVTRMPYSLFPKSNDDNNVVSFVKQGTELNSINRFQKINWQLSYRYQAARHFAIGASYTARWMQSSQPKKLAATDTHFDITLSYTY